MAKRFESGMRIVLMPEEERERAVARPEKLRGQGRERASERYEERGAVKENEAYEGAVSATMTVNLRLRAAALRNASTVLLCPMVRITSL